MMLESRIVTFLGINQSANLTAGLPKHGPARERIMRQIHGLLVRLP